MADPIQKVEKTEVDTSMGSLPVPMMGVESRCINELRVCPYEESHVVSGGRYQKHLEVCAAKNDRRKLENDVEFEDDKKLETCPYDSSHHIHPSVMKKHIELCEGYYKDQQYNQVDPPSMRQSFPRYNVPMPEHKMPLEIEEDDAASISSEVSSVYCTWVKGKETDTDRALKEIPVVGEDDKVNFMQQYEARKNTEDAGSRVLKGLGRGRLRMFNDGTDVNMK